MSKNLYPSFIQEDKHLLETAINSIDAVDYSKKMAETQRSNERSIADVIKLQLQGYTVDTSTWSDFTDYSFAEKFIPGLKIRYAGGWVPFQAEGIWGSYEFYYRDRSGIATLRLAPIGTFPGYDSSLYVSSCPSSDNYGKKPFDWLDQFLSLWISLSRATPCWEFPSRTNVFFQDPFDLPETKEKKSTVHGYGWTMESALQSIFQRLATHYGEEKTHKIMELNGIERGFRRSPDFPSEDPKFANTVNIPENYYRSAIRIPDGDYPKAVAKSSSDDS